MLLGIFLPWTSGCQLECSLSGLAYARRKSWGRPNAPKLYSLMVEISETELNPELGQKAELIVRTAPSQKNIKEKGHDLLGKRSNYLQGKCDWCGDTPVAVYFFGFV